MIGKADIIKGRIEEAAGALTGSEKLRTEGQTDQAVGHVKENANQAISGAKEAASKTIATAKKASQRTIDRVKAAAKKLSE
jgi:uncharacterized protein YjbJ (UPF0337 family)